MSPPTRIAWGLLLVIIDLRFNGFDVVVDLPGWLLVIWGVVALRGRSPWFDLAGLGAVGAAVLSLAELTGPPAPVMSTVEILAHTAVVFGTCSGIRAVAGRESVARTADGIRWLDLVLTVVLLLATAATGARPVQTAWVIPMVVVGLGVAIWFVVFLFTLRGDPTLQDRQVATS